MHKDLIGSMLTEPTGKEKIQYCKPQNFNYKKKLLGNNVCKSYGEYSHPSHLSNPKACQAMTIKTAVIHTDPQEH